MGQTHLSNAIIDSIWTFACLATPQVPTNKNTRYCTIVETHFRAVAAFIPVVSQLIVSTVLSWKTEITAGRDWAFTTGNHPCSVLPLVASIRLFASFGYICPDIKHSGHRRVWMNMKQELVLVSRFPPITVSCLMFCLSSNSAVALSARVSGIINLISSQNPHRHH